MSCCSDLDWSKVDMTREHHPQCPHGYNGPTLPKLPLGKSPSPTGDLKFGSYGPCRDDNWEAFQAYVKLPVKIPLETEHKVLLDAGVAYSELKLGSADPDSAVRVASCRPVNTDVSSRRGRFVITQQFLDEAVHYDAEALTRLMALFGQMVITRCEMVWDTGVFEYLAVSRLFDPIPDGERPPWYKLECSDGHWAARREK